MQALAFFLLYPLIWLVSKMPMSWLYFLSDTVAYPLLHRLIGYRLKVVRANMERALPELSEAERMKVEEKFYRFLADMFVETIKGFTTNEKFLKPRLKMLNPEILDKYKSENKRVVVTMGHYGNYEWMGSGMPFFLAYRPILVPYRKLTNKYFDRLFKASRTRFGLEIFHTFHTQQELEKRADGKFMIVLGNDQAARPGKAYWAEFLHQPTSFFIGTEKIARDWDAAVVYAEVRRPQRGQYEMYLELITENPNEEPLGSIMEAHVQKLQATIRKEPAYWLWTHRRWKHAMPAGTSYGFDTPIQ